jgi:hypothetical protein
MVRVEYLEAILKQLMNDRNSLFSHKYSEVRSIIHHRISFS